MKYIVTLTFETEEDRDAALEALEDEALSGFIENAFDTHLREEED